MHDDARNASAASPLMAPTSRPPPTTFVSIDLASVILPLTRIINKCTLEAGAADHILDTLSDTLTHQQ